MCLWFHTLSLVCAVYHYIRHLTQYIYSQCNKRLIPREIVAKARTRKKKKKKQERVGHKSKLIRLPLFRVKRQQVTNLMRPSCGVGGGWGRGPCHCLCFTIVFGLFYVAVAILTHL